MPAARALSSPSRAAKEDKLVERENSQRQLSFQPNDIKFFFGGRASEVRNYGRTDVEVEKVF